MEICVNLVHQIKKYVQYFCEVQILGAYEVQSAKCIIRISGHYLIVFDPKFNSKKPAKKLTVPIGEPNDQRTKFCLNFISSDNTSVIEKIRNAK